MTAFESDNLIKAVVSRISLALCAFWPIGLSHYLVKLAITLNFKISVGVYF